MFITDVSNRKSPPTVPWLESYRKDGQDIEHGSDVHYVCTLLRCLSQVVRTECHVPNASRRMPAFEIVMSPNEIKGQAFELLDSIRL